MAFSKCLSFFVVAISTYTFIASQPLSNSLNNSTEYSGYLEDSGVQEFVINNQTSGSYWIEYEETYSFNSSLNYDPEPGDSWLNYDSVPDNASLTYDPEPDDPSLTYEPPAENYSHKKSHIYPWNKTQFSPLDYQQSYCPMRCKGDNVVYINNLLQMACPRFYCATCSCHRPSCEIYDVCCPDITENYLPPPGLKSGIFSQLDFDLNVNLTDQPETVDGFFNTRNITNKVDSRTQRKPPTLDCEAEFSALHTNFLYVRSCAEDYQGDVVKLCEEDVSPEEITLDLITRVVDTDTQVVYRNKFCAQCNNVTKPSPLLLKIKCKNFMPVYKATSRDEMLRLARADVTSCVVTQYFQQDTPTVPCKSYQYSHPTIDHCNTSFGSDNDVADACRELSGNSHLVYSRTSKQSFTNIFCGICNLTKWPRYGVCTSRSGNGEPANVRTNPPLSLLLNFGRRRLAQSPAADKNRFINCSANMWPSPDGRCLALRCTPGKLLDNNTCYTVVPRVSGLGYRLRLWLVPEGDVIYSTTNFIFDDSNFTVSIYDSDADSNSTVSMSSLLDRLQSKLVELLSECGGWSLNISAIGRQHKTQQHNPIVLWVDGNLLASPFLMRDEFETAITQTLINTHISLDIGTHGNVSFRTVAMVTAHEYILLDTMESPSRNVLSMVSENYHSQKGLIAYSNSFLNISNLLWCSYVSFNKTSYTIEVDETRAPPKINIELDLVGTRITFSEFSELNMLALDGDGVLNVCRQLLDTKLGQMDLKASRVVDLIDPDIVKAEYILTVVLLAVSMGCLLLTVMTYMCFTKLRSRAGKSNMCLSGSLLLAQGSLLASSHLSGPSWLCTAVGVSTHFLWLWMFTWTFICSFQMFRVFTAKTRGSALTSREETCQFVRQVCLSLLAPLLVVTSVIVTSLATNDDGGTGYGNTVCYLDSTLLIGVALVLPLSLIIVTNLTFFITTVVIIYRVGQLQSKDHARREDRKNLFVYAKLSSMTGAFWIFAIVAEATDLSALRFLSIVMNGLQGVFIFLSYTFNKRVLNLYLVSAGLEPLPTSRFSSEIKSRTESTSVRH